MAVDEPTWTDNTVATTITVGDSIKRVRYSASTALAGRGDFLLAAMLLPAMATADRLRLRAPVSPGLLATTSRIQEIFATWGPTWHMNYVPVQVDAPRAELLPADTSGVACFFSGGVDSFYTLLRHREDITAIIFIHGFDISLGDTGLRERAAQTARDVADALSIDLIEVETDLRAFTDPVASWQPYHGGALASVALLFQHRFDRVLVPATHTYAEMFPWGSHPLLDPLWSTERTEIEHSGAEATRVAKVATLADSDLAMRYLRVCWENLDGAYNCGRCEKCVRTMLNLAAGGALGRCETLPSQLDADRVASMRLRSMNDVAFARENRAALQALGGYDEIVEAIAVAERAATETAAEQRVKHAERYADDMRRSLEEFQATRRYRLAQALGRPLDWIRAATSS